MAEMEWKRDVGFKCFGTRAYLWRNGAWRIYHIQNLGFPRFDRRWQFPYGGCHRGNDGGRRDASLTHLACKFCCRGGGRDIDRDYPCEIKSAGFVVWHYYDDGVVYH